MCRDVALVKLSEMKLALCVPDHVPERHKTRQGLDHSESIYTELNHKMLMSGEQSECTTALKTYVVLPA